MKTRKWTIAKLPGWQKVVRAMENSSYFESLEVKVKERYREKLSCVGLNDPYLPTNDARSVYLDKDGWN